MVGVFRDRQDVWAFALGCTAVTAGVLLHLPMYWMGRETGFRLADMPMDRGMIGGMFLIVAGIIVSAYGLLPATGIRPPRATPPITIHAPEDAPLSLAHWWLMVVLVGALVIDVMKPAALGFVMPGMVSEYAVPKQTASLVPFFALIGTVTGSVVWGLIADVYGRKASILLSAVVFVGTSICGAMPSLSWNVGMCFLMGMGAGGMLPVTYALLAETMPSKHRGWALVLVGGLGAAGGYFAASGLSALLVPTFSWRILWLVNLPTGLLLIFLGVFIPESAKFLLSRGRTAEAEAVMARFGTRKFVLEKGRVDEIETVAPLHLEDQVPSMQLWTPTLVGKTAALSMAAITWGLVNFGLLLWLPGALVEQGYSMGVSSQLLAKSALIAFPTVFLCALMYSRWSTRWSLICMTGVTLLGLLWVLLLETRIGGSPVFPVALLIVGSNGLLAILLPYASESYPLRIRGRATGWVAACTKGGGVLAQALSITALVPPLGTAALMIIAPMSIALILIVRYGTETRGMDLQELEVKSAARRRAGGATAVILCLMALSSVCTPVLADELRIEHVTVVSPERASPLRDASVTIKDDRIVAISHRAGMPKAASKAQAVDRTDKLRAIDGAGTPRAADGTGKLRTVDGTGLCLTPGLIDSHVHSSDPPGFGNAQGAASPEIVRAIREQVPRSYLQFGYTTLIDVISKREQITAWNAHELHPDLYFCGGASIPGGYPLIQQVGPEDRQSLLTYMIVQRGEEGKAPEGVDPATHTPEAVVALMKSDGALCVKTFYERGYGEVDEMPVPRLDTIRDLVKAAHAAHMLVFIHANGTDSQEFAVKSGADIIAHGLWHWNREPQATELTPRARQILDDVLEANLGWQPTMQVLNGLQDLFDPAYLSDPLLAKVTPASAIEWYRSAPGQWFHDVLAPGMLSKQVMESHDPQAQLNEARAALSPPITRGKNAVRYMATHGAKILFGTDTPSAPTYANQPGLNGLREMQALVAAGMTPLQVFRAATQTNAEVLGLASDIGTVQVGKRANLLLLRGDPTQSVDAFGQIVKIVLHGRVVEPAELAADRSR